MLLPTYRGDNSIEHKNMFNDGVNEVKELREFPHPVKLANSPGASTSCNVCIIIIAIYFIQIDLTRTWSKFVIS